MRCAGAAETISTHALREEGDIKLMVSPPAQWISTHALREEGDKKPDC